MISLQKPVVGLGKRAVEILLVEDNPGDASLLRETFKRSRFDIRLNVVPDGEKALDYLRPRDPYRSSPKPDLILLDLNLPRINGHEVAAQVMSSRRLNGIPILLLTGSNRDEDKWRACETRVSAYLVKPVELRHYDTLLNYLEEHWFKDLRPDLPPGTAKGLLKEAYENGNV